MSLAEGPVFSAIEQIKKRLLRRFFIACSFSSGGNANVCGTVHRSEGPCQTAGLVIGIFIAN